MSDQGIFATDPQFPTLQVKSLNNVDKYISAAEIFDCNPERSVILSSEIKHIEAAGRANFRGILLHEDCINPDTVCSPYPDPRRPSDRTSLGLTLCRFLEPDGQLARQNREEPVRSIIFYPMHTKPNGQFWLV